MFVHRINLYSKVVIRYYNNILNYINLYIYKYVLEYLDIWNIMNLLNSHDSMI